MDMKWCGEQEEEKGGQGATGDIRRRSWVIPCMTALSLEEPCHTHTHTHTHTHPHNTCTHIERRLVCGWLSCWQGFLISRPTGWWHSASIRHPLSAFHTPRTHTHTHTLTHPLHSVHPAAPSFVRIFIFLSSSSMI